MQGQYYTDPKIRQRAHMQTHTYVNYRPNISGEDKCKYSQDNFERSNTTIYSKGLYTMTKIHSRDAKILQCATLNAKYEINKKKSKTRIHINRCWKSI